MTAEVVTSVDGDSALGPDGIANIRDAGEPVIDPDGVRCAVVVGQRDDYRLWVLGDGRERVLEPALRAEAPICWYRTDAGAVLISVGDQNQHQLLTWREPFSGVGRAVTPSPDVGRIMAIAVAGRSVIVLARRSGRGRVWAIDIATGSCRSLTAEHRDVADMSAAPSHHHMVVIYRTEGGAQRTGGLTFLDTTVPDLSSRPLVPARIPGSRERLLDVSPGGEQALFSREIGSGGYELAVLDRVNRAVRSVPVDAIGTIMKARWLSETAIVLQMFERTKSRLRVVPVGRGRSRVLAEPNSAYPKFSVSTRTGAVAFAGESAEAPADIYTVTADEEPTRLTDLNPQVRSAQRGSVREVSWISHRDRTRIHGLLVLPDGPARPPYPTIVNVHGGPHFHWHAGWLGSWIDWAQMLSSHGYATFLPNPRGSTGKSWEFAHAIRGALGDLPLADVLDGVDFLVDEKIADSARLGIGGWSYGGFLTAWAATHTHRFAAAVAGAGIYDVYSFVGASPMGDAWTEFFPAGQFPDRSAFDLASPLTYLARCRTPMLVIHGNRDPKIGIEQGRMLSKGLAQLPVPSKWVELDGGGHRLDATQHRIQLMREVLAWYLEHIPVEV